MAERVDEERYYIPERRERVRKPLKRGETPKRLRKKEHILEIAKKIFAQNGYRNTTMEDIANELELTAAALYHYYSSKDEIFRACIKSEADKVMNEIKRAIELVDDPVAKLKAFVKAKVRTIEKIFQEYSVRPEIITEIKSEIEAMRDAEFHEAEKEILKRILEEGKRKGVFDIKNMKEAIFILLSIAGKYEELMKWSDKEIERVVETIIDGLRK